jgi:4-amino-4-deoxy-L-arabinose transferase-like glycosyltransferase
MSGSKTGNRLSGKLSNKRKILAGLVLLMVLGGLLRFSGLEKTGPFFVDQGGYMLGAWWYCEIASLMAESFPHWIQSPPEQLGTELLHLFRQAEGQPMIMGRPFHNLLGAIPMFFVGYEPYIGNMVSAFFGVLSLPALLLLYRKLYGPRGSLAATALLALMGIHVYYSRNFFPEADSTFFLLLSFIFYMKSRERVPEAKTADWAALRALFWIALCGFCWGLAVTASDRWLAMLIILWILEAHLLLREFPPWVAEPAPKKFSRLPTRFLWILVRLGTLHAFILIPIFAFGLPYVLLRVLLWRECIPMPFPGYFQLLGKHFIIAQAAAAARFMDALPVSGFRFSDLLIFPDINLRFNGIFYTFFLILGIVRSLWRKHLGDLVILSCLFVPIAYLQTQVYHCARHYSITFPIIAILVARGLFADRLFEEKPGGTDNTCRERGPRIVVAILLLVTLASGISASLKAGRYSFGYPEASHHLKGLNAKVLATSGDIFGSYLGRHNSKDIPTSDQQLSSDLEAGYRYFVVDFIPEIWKLLEELGFNNEEHSQRLAMVKRITEQSDPIAEFPNSWAATPYLTFEVLFHYRDAFTVAERIRSAGGDMIRIYELPEPQGRPEEGKYSPDRPSGSTQTPLARSMR